MEVFLAVVEEGSLTAGARRAGISQSAVSQLIGNLEDQVGENLLIRKARGVEATEAGRLFAEFSRKVVSEGRALRAAFEQRQGLQAGEVRFGMIPTLAPYLLPRVLCPFREKYPAVEISVVEGKTARLLEMVAGGEIEFAIVAEVPPADRKRWGVSLSELFQEELKLAVPDGHELATSSKLPQPKAMRGEQMIILSGGHCLAAKSMKICGLRDGEGMVSCDQLETALAMVAAGLGVTVVPDLATRKSMPQGVTLRSFDGEGAYRAVNFARKKSHRLSRAAEALLAEMG
ncbi:MAG: LysR substrate-binding domain-containing protein [Verrucomicrobiota bacterium JB023]|nr:LysR substrate-binding domain-containing protein [Verrucomicrobiota bacterium JB023]